VRVVPFLLADKALHVLKIGNLAWDGDGALLPESKFLFSFLEEFLEQRMVYIQHRYYKTLQFFSFTAHVHGHAALGNTLVNIVPLL